MSRNDYELCSCEESQALLDDIHIIAKSMQIFCGRECVTLFEDLDPAWEILKKHGYKWKGYPAEYKQNPKLWKRRKNV